VAPTQARPEEVASRLADLLVGFEGKMLGDINGELCRAFASKHSGARRKLEDLRAAINHHRKEGHCSQIVEVVLPEKARPRERWLTRSEAAKLILGAWRYREKQMGSETDRRPRRHVARFMLVGLYTGSRASRICSAAFDQTSEHGFIDTDRGVFYRRAPGERVTKKRAPPIPLPGRLLAHLRRWKRKGQKFAVEYDHAPVKRVNKAFGSAVKDARLGADVVPHTLRHTAATWMMQQGVDPWEAAGYLGMTVQTLIDNYGHHHPDHLKGAVRAFDQRRR
jgi:integrase